MLIKFAEDMKWEGAANPGEDKELKDNALGKRVRHRKEIAK